MNEAEAQAAPLESGYSVSAAAIAWAITGAIFVLLRVGPVWQAPVGGAELDGLAGAWQAHIGVADDRFVPTVASWIASLTFAFGDSEVPIRLLAVLVAASIPFALYQLRPLIGDAAAIIALLFLALDGPVINLTASGSAAAFDVPITLWLLAALARSSTVPEWGWAPIAAIVTLSGPLALPLVLAAAVVRFGRGARVPLQPVLFAAAGVVLALLLTLFEPGGGISAPSIPPIEVLAQAFSNDWSTATGLEILVFYGLPVVVTGAAGAAALVRRQMSGGTLDAFELLLLVWAGLAAVWMVGALGSGQTLANAALSLPLALLAGMWLPRAIDMTIEADWSMARYLVPVALLALVFAYYPAAEWARLDQVQGDQDMVLVVAGIAVFAIAVAAVAVDRNARHALLGLVGALGGVLLLMGGLGVALSGISEPIPSPVSTAQARELRDLAVAARDERGGEIVAHIDLRSELTWPFRDSGTIVLSSNVPEEATLVVWLPELPAPEGFLRVDGTWALTASVRAATGDWLELVQWFGHRNADRIDLQEVAVYVRAEQ